MAHLDTSYELFKLALVQASAVWKVDLNALNSSGTDGTAIIAMSEAADGTPYFSVALSATGATPGVPHLSHIHGAFDGGGNVANSVSPTIASDADGDGIVEVLEGVASYGDVILTLVDPDGNPPMANADGNISFVGVFDLTDPDNLRSPVTSTQYTIDDLMPLDFREIVVHGVDLPAGIGAGTGGEADGSGGFTPILPAAAGEIEEISVTEAAAILEDHEELATDRLIGTNKRDEFDAGQGDDLIRGKLKRDDLDGGEGDDFIFGGRGFDTIDGGDGNDSIDGHRGNDLLTGGEGADTFLFQFVGTGRDKITDFESGIDTLDLSGHGVARADLNIFENGRGNAVVDYEGGRAVLLGVSLDEFNPETDIITNDDLTFF